jgi:hypothetical protein
MTATVAIAAVGHVTVLVAVAYLLLSSLRRRAWNWRCLAEESGGGSLRKAPRAFRTPRLPESVEGRARPTPLTLREK